MVVVVVNNVRDHEDSFIYGGIWYESVYIFDWQHKDALFLVLCMWRFYEGRQWVMSKQCYGCLILLRPVL